MIRALPVEKFKRLAKRWPGVSRVRYSCSATLDHELEEEIRVHLAIETEQRIAADRRNKTTFSYRGLVGILLRFCVARSGPPPGGGKSHFTSLMPTGV